MSRGGVKYAFVGGCCGRAPAGRVRQFRARIGIRLDLHAHGQENRRLLLPSERWQAVLSAGQDVHRPLLLQGG